jgi:acyl-CoA synthetase (AMP-forming)/AMP-acid ligase II
MIGNQLSINACRYSEHIALVYGDKRFSYAKLNDRCCQLANSLNALGVKPGDRVACLINNCSQFIEIFFALAKLGAIFVPINFRLTAREIAELLAQSRPVLLFLGNSLASLRGDAHLNGRLPANVIILNDELESANSCADMYEGFLQAGDTSEPSTVVQGDDPQLLVYSSGTTGHPKGAIWTHKTTLASSCAKIIDFQINCSDVTVVFGPLFHVGPLMDLAIPVMLRGGRLIVGTTQKFDPSKLLRVVSDEKVTIATIYPTMWRRVLALDNLEQFDPSSLRLLFTGGEPIPVPLLRQIYSRFPTAGFINTYGSTEAGPITTFLAPEESENKIGSVGKPAFTVEVRIVDEKGEMVESGQVGEVLVRSPFVCNGYWDNRAEDAPFRKGDWWHTGDLARRDQDGFLWIAGRKKDMIISGAENIYPAEIERVIAELDDVLEVAVVGVPDEEWGESVAVYVVRMPGSELGAAQIIEHCRRSLASYKKPRHVFFIDALPRTTVNKISKAELRSRFSEN